MKLNTQKRSIETSGVTISSQFRMDMNGKSFGVLTEGIYSDIIPTIVRELSSNAFDSHKAAGKIDEPFEVHLPTNFDPYFMVRDFGTGLRYFRYDAVITNEHEGESAIFIDGDVREDIRDIDTVVIGQSFTAPVMNILYDRSGNQTVIRIPVDISGQRVVEFDDTLVLYSTYFRSTKDTTNDYTGAFGLGSKTPLAYTDNFIVTNRFENTERVYSISIGEDGTPEIKLMGMMETDEPNGLEVKLAVDATDNEDFRRAVNTQLRYFQPQPTIFNAKVEMPKIVYEGEHFLLLEGENLDLSDYNEHHACVGNNSYLIQGSRVRGSSVFNKGNVVVKFAIGEVDVTTSRESLKYSDNAKINFMAQRLEDAFEEYRDYVYDSLETEGLTSREIAQLIVTHSDVIDITSDKIVNLVNNPDYVHQRSGIYVRMIPNRHTNLDWRENEKGDMVVNKHYSRISYPIGLASYSTWNRRIEDDNPSGDKLASFDEDIMVFVKDSSYAFLKKIKHYLEVEGDAYDRIYVIHAPNMDDEKREAIEGMIEVADGNYNLDVVYLSNVELPKNQSTSTSTYKTPNARQFNSSHKNTATSPSYWDDVYVPLTKIEDDQKVYVLGTHRNNIETLSGTELNFLRQIVDTKHWDDSTVIYALPMAKYEKMIEYGFTPLNEYLKELTAKISLPVDAKNRMIFSDLHDKLGRNRVLRFFDNLSDEHIAKIKDSDAVYLTRLNNVLSARYYGYDWRDTKKFKRDRIERMKSEIALFNQSGQEIEIDEDTQAELDRLSELCDTIETELSFVSHIYFSSMTDNAKEKLLQFINFVSNNTGETNE